MLPVAILSTVAFLILAYFKTGTLVIDAERKQDDKAERQAEQLRLNDDEM